MKKFVDKWFGLLIILTFIVGMFCLVLNVTKDYQTSGIANQVEKARSAVVHIEKVGECQGSGALISSDGLIFTAKHVTDGGGKFIVTLDNGQKFETNVCVESEFFDVAFLKIKSDKPFYFVSLAKLDDVRVGDPVFIMGSPFGRDNFNSVSLGILSARQRNLDNPEPYGYGWQVTFQSDATAEPGNSGGPVFNLDGEVIGVLVAGMDATINYSVPVSVFIFDLDVVKQWFELSRFNLVESPKKIIHREDIYRCH